MSGQSKDLMFVLAAAYDDDAAAAADYQAVKALYREVTSPHDFDAAVLARDPDGAVRILDRHEQATRHGAPPGLAWGLAGGVVAALYPSVGARILAAGGAGGAAIGAVLGHVGLGMSRAALRDLGETLDAGRAGLIAVYELDLADQVVATVTSAGRLMHGAIEVVPDQIAADLVRAEAAERSTARRQAAASPDAPAVMTATGDD